MSRTKLHCLPRNICLISINPLFPGISHRGETAEETAIREVREEIGIEIERLEYAGTYWFETKGLLMHGFIGYASKGAFKLSKEVDNAEWVPSAEIEKLIFPESPGNSMHPL